MLKRLLAVLAILALVIVPATAEEAIRQYDVNVKLLPDRSVDVTEMIEVNAEGIDIRHGIYRDIPFSLRNDDGSLLRSKLTILSVTRDGAPEPYSTETLENHIERIQIGSADTFLDDGLHRYEIHYTMTRMGRSFADHDELFWNVTGNYWIFPIRSAVATIVLPAGATISDVVGYTGPPGSQEQAVSITRVNDTTAVVRTSRELRAGEGMSVAVAFPAGVLQPAGNDPADWLSDHRDLVGPPLAVLVVLGYFLYAWSRVGRDPARGTIIPLFHPPEGYEPAALQYIDRMGWQQNGWSAFTASIFDLGVKGLITIDKSGKALTMTPTGKAAGELPRGEALVHDFLTRDGGPFKVDKTTGAGINSTRSQMLAAVAGGIKNRYFHKNRLPAIFGILLSFIVLFAMVVADVLPLEGVIGAAVAVIILGVVASMIRSGRSRGGLLRFLPILWMVIVGVNVLGGLGLSLMRTHFDLAWIAVASIIAIDVIFFALMPAPTPEGRKLMDQIDGFKMYVDTAEKDRLNLVGEPPMTITRFESILPFAIALGIEKPWSHYFESELARNAVADAPGGRGGYSPIWYSGSDFSSRGFSNGLSAMAAGMSAAMIAAQPASSSSSGFSGGGGGGGGGSGGGGGGGGGGGW